MRPSAIVEFGEAKLVIVQATGLIGMQRSIITYQEAEKNKDEKNEAVKIFRSITYPDLVAPVTEAKGTIAIYDGEGKAQLVDLSKWPPTLEQVMAMPDELIYAWEQAVYQLNPHWNPANRVQNAEAQKKEPSSPGV
jgi:hypothetical protein